ncbi:salicylate hydroxylase [Fusarium pseudocircinatum]|uniref:Salicylate hydroxylase n=1 Tax=Fusarium pseudocircinatum TaxID=56676 RepID=A0A8H5KMJ7_9HYPO|nr:salicylate hydroxylase [Fusarium pseudocircinatum]
MAKQDKSLDVVIIGAGLAGLLAARVLREKHNVKVYERSTTPIEVGAAINVGPNGVRILETLGFDRSRAGSLPVGATKVFTKEGHLQLDEENSYVEKYAADGIKSIVRPHVVGDAALQTARPSALPAFLFTLALDDIKAALEIAKNIKLWQLRDQEPLPTYVRGRAVSIGDAAHVMTPHQGQGGTQAVEDAEGFRLFLQKGVTSEHVPELLKGFETVCRPRASQIQNNTRKAKNKRTAEEVYRFEKINWTYGGIMEELKAVKETSGMRRCK